MSAFFSIMRIFVSAFLLAMVISCTGGKTTTTSVPGANSELVQSFFKLAQDFAQGKKTDTEVEAVFKELKDPDICELAGKREQGATVIYFLVSGKASDAIKRTINALLKALKPTERAEQINTKGPDGFNAYEKLQQKRPTGEDAKDTQKLMDELLVYAPELAKAASSAQEVFDEAKAASVATGAKPVTLNLAVAFKTFMASDNNGDKAEQLYLINRGGVDTFIAVLLALDSSDQRHEIIAEYLARLQKRGGSHVYVETSALGGSADHKLFIMDLADKVDEDLLTDILAGIADPMPQDPDAIHKVVEVMYDYLWQVKKTKDNKEMSSVFGKLFSSLNLGDNGKKQLRNDLVKHVIWHAGIQGGVKSLNYVIRSGFLPPAQISADYNLIEGTSVPKQCQNAQGTLLYAGLFYQALKPIYQVISQAVGGPAVSIQIPQASFILDTVVRGVDKAQTQTNAAALPTAFKLADASAGQAYDACKDSITFLNHITPLDVQELRDAIKSQITNAEWSTMANKAGNGGTTAPPANKKAWELLQAIAGTVNIPNEAAAQANKWLGNY